MKLHGESMCVRIMLSLNSSAKHYIHFQVVQVLVACQTECDLRQNREQNFTFHCASKKKATNLNSFLFHIWIASGIGLHYLTENLFEKEEKQPKLNEYSI